MSAAVTGAGVLGASAPVSRRVRAFFAPVNRATEMPAAMDLVAIAGMDPDAMPAPWVDLGAVRRFVRRSGTKVEAVRAGSPATAREQVRTEIDAVVELLFERWGKLQLALSAGVPQLNLLTGAAVPLVMGAGTTATTLNVGAGNAARFPVGSMVAVDADFAGATGFVGSGVSGGYVGPSGLPVADVDYVRRVTLNVALVTDVAGGVLTLAAPLLAGAPVAGMQVSQVAGFVDREGGGFFQEWSGLIIADGEQGDRMFYLYPRLQAMAGAAEESEVLGGSLAEVRLQGIFRALAVKDSNDGSQVVCYRGYVPAPMRLL